MLKLIVTVAAFIFSCASYSKQTLDHAHVCPDQTAKVYEKTTNKPFDFANVMRVCVKIVSATTHTPATADFWTYSNGKRTDHGKRTGSACFKLGYGTGSVNAGTVTAATSIFTSIDVLAANDQLLDEDVISRIAVPPVTMAPNGEPLNPCLPKCKQMPKPDPNEAGSHNGNKCRWTCDGSYGGIWHRTCGGVTFNRKGKEESN